MKKIIDILKTKVIIFSNTQEKVIFWLCFLLVGFLFKVDSFDFVNIKPKVSLFNFYLDMFPFVFFGGLGIFEILKILPLHFIGSYSLSKIIYKTFANISKK
jgi:hypothetical protein